MQNLFGLADFDTRRDSNLYYVVWIILSSLIEGYQEGGAQNITTGFQSDIHIYIPVNSTYTFNDSLLKRVSLLLCFLLLPKLQGSHIIIIPCYIVVIMS